MYKDYANLRKAIGKVQKSATNPHFKTTYVELNTALQVIDEQIESHNFICFVQVPVTIEGKNYLNTKLIHKDGGIIEGNLELITTKQDPQMLGSSLTYARRYSLITILGLQAVDDDGNAGAGHTPPAENEKVDKKEVKAKVDKVLKLLDICENMETFNGFLADEEVKKDMDWLNYNDKVQYSGVKQKIKIKMDILKAKEGK